MSSLRPFLRVSLLCFVALTLLAPARAAVQALPPSRNSAPWIRDAVVYEVFPRQFSPEGNFAGVTTRLDELKDLGVTVVWLMPIHPIGRVKAKGSVGSPYAVQDYYAVNPDYGTKDDFRRLVTEAHRRGLKVIIDIVANHTAWDSVMLQHPEYYKRDAAGQVIPPNPDWTDVAGLDYRNPETCRYMTDMLKYWIREFDLDGFRCDVAGEVPTSFWENARVELEGIKPGLFLLAEASKPDLLVKAFDSDYAWPMLGTMNRVLMEGAPATEIERTWRKGEQEQFPTGTRHLRFTDNHDEPRAIARFGWKAALAASIMTYSLDGLPLVYNGMEVGDTSESGDPALFEKLGVFWHPKQREHFRATYREYFAFRRTHPAFAGTQVEWLENSASRDVVSFARADVTEELVVVVNLSNRPVTVSVKTPGPGRYQQALPQASKPADETDLTGLALGAFEWRIYRRPQAP
ncbi:MAG TPA: alpha-amylase family glycosyl hydrolase [Opitutaceae bacterium]|nr:alpha-amylase family glycosyl hydrolase [Opitutaceae bacterium]